MGLNVPNFPHLFSPPGMLRLCIHTVKVDVGVWISVTQGAIEILDQEMFPVECQYVALIELSEPISAGAQDHMVRMSSWYVDGRSDTAHALQTDRQGGWSRCCCTLLGRSGGSTVTDRCDIMTMWNRLPDLGCARNVR